MVAEGAGCGGGGKRRICCRRGKPTLARDARAPAVAGAEPGIALALPRMLAAAALAAARRAAATSAATAGRPPFWRALSTAATGTHHLPLSSTAASLAWADAPSARPPGADASGLRRALLRMGGFYSRETSIARGARGMHDAVTSQVDNPAFVAALGLRPGTFADTHALLCVHVWLLLVRLRPEGRDGKDAAQALYENFSDDVEARVRAAGVKVRIGKWLAELEKMFYGAASAYDAALGRPGVARTDGGGAPAAAEFAPAGAAARSALADALLRNVYAGDPANAGAAGAAADYVLRELACLAATPSEAILTGALRFTAPVAKGVLPERKAA